MDETVCKTFDFKTQKLETGYQRSRHSTWSTIWLYYDKLDDKAVCKICGVTMKHNTIRHLRRLHPIAYKEWQKERNKINDLSKDEDSDDDSTNSPSKSKRGAKRSSIWLFYKNINGNATCNICGFAMKNNKIRHLKKKHPGAYIQWHDIREKNNEYPWLMKAVDVPNRSSQGAIWLFYKKVDGSAVCKTCGTSMKYNKIRHLQKKHPTVYKKWQSIRKENNEFPWSAKVNSTKADSTCSMWVKQYLKKIGINQYRCELCHTSLKMIGSDYGNIKRHIRVKHPYIYDQEMRDSGQMKNKKYIKSEKSTEDVVEYVVEYIENDPLIDDKELIYSISKSKEKHLKNNEVNPNSYETSIELEEVDKDEELKNSDDSDDTDDNLELSEILRDNDPLLEDKIEQLCNKHLEDKRQRNKTCFWNFFDVLDENHLYRCLFCGKQVAIYPKSISNLKRHLENKHIWQYNLILKYAPDNDTCKTTRSKPVKRSHSDDASNEDFDFLDRESFKCKICEKMVICGEDKKKLFDHFVEEHPESVVKGHSEDLLNADSEYKVIIDADDNSYIIEI